MSAPPVPRRRPGGHVAGGRVAGGRVAGGAAPRHHIVTAMVENKAGVLARVASLFSRRGFNIFSLAVAPTDDERFSRITIVVDVESAPLEQIMKQLDKLVNVVSITELAPDEAVEREMLLVTVECGLGRSAGRRPGGAGDAAVDRSTPSTPRSSDEGRRPSDRDAGGHPEPHRRLREPRQALRHHRAPADGPGGPA